MNKSVVKKLGDLVNIKTGKLDANAIVPAPRYASKNFPTAIMNRNGTEITNINSPNTRRPVINAHNPDKNFIHFLSIHLVMTERTATMACPPCMSHDYC